MKFKLIAILIFSLLVGCKNEDVTSQIAKLEKELSNGPNTEVSNQLIALYQKYIDQHPDATDQNGKFTFDMAKQHYANGQFQEAADALKNGIKNYYNSASTSANISLLATVLSENLLNPKTEGTIFSSLKGIFPDEAGLKTKLSGLIDNYKGKIYNETTNRLDKDASSTFVGLCEMFAGLLPQNSESPVYLFQAGETARSVGAYQKAIHIYDKIYKNFKGFDRAPQALFLKAFTLDDNLKKHDAAKPIYEDFLKKYPNDDFADDTQFLLENLGKTDDEIIKKFEG